SGSSPSPRLRRFNANQPTLLVHVVGRRDVEHPAAAHRQTHLRMNRPRQSVRTHLNDVRDVRRYLVREHTLATATSDEPTSPRSDRLPVRINAQVRASGHTGILPRLLNRHATAELTGSDNHGH